MYTPPISLPSDLESLRRTLETELYTLSGVLQSIGNGQEFPHAPSLAKQQFWDDLCLPFFSGQIKGDGINDPDLYSLTGGIKAFRFPDGAAKEIYFAFHVGHDIRRNTKLYPFIQWTTAGASAGVVRWGIEYTVAKSHGQEAFPATTIAYLQQGASGVAFRNMLVEAPEANAIAVGIEPDSIILARVFRDGEHAADTCADAAFGLVVGFHYLKGYWATKNKGPNFYE